MNEIPKFEGNILDIGNDYFLVKKSVVYDWSEQMKNLQRDLEQLNVKRAIKNTGTVSGKEGRNSLLNSEQKEQVIELRKRGYSLRQIAEVFGVSHETIRNVESESKDEQKPIKKEFRNEISFNERLEVQTMFENGKSIETIREKTGISDRTLRFVIAEKCGGEKFCTGCQKSTQHLPRVKGGRESCVECGKIVAVQSPEVKESNIFGKKQISSDPFVKD